ncbi:hypothetical protein QVD17_39859 [Tagetes erecta]|uniref:RWP-RK domain-containing protein n=1 Tax=Tagetes erecta TaxID=13708 RepID=A0AAD8JRJ1_TARER|nr:hypothetical protein QVD17_39859 [Tagetes erecta]
MDELPVMMTVDLDLDGFDQFDPNPSLSFILSPSQQCLSPLWDFSDDNELNNGDDTRPTFTSSHLLLSDNQDQVTRKQLNTDISMPLLEVNPPENQDVTCLIKERMTMALRYFIELGEKQVLAQVWAPVKNKGGRNVLTTSGQPFVLDPNCTGLHQYRMASLMYTLSLDCETGEALEIPSRVFRQKLPEWTPNVQYYSDKEYQRLNHALSYDVRGTLAVPVFEPSGQSCVGVIELILTSQKINYAPEVDKLCKALEVLP